MQSHEDSTHQDRFMQQLRERAEKMKASGDSEITGGKPGEKPLAKWKHGDVHVKHMPDDEQGILRISAGGGNTPVPLNYLVIRGDVSECVNLLTKALAALKAAP